MQFPQLSLFTYVITIFYLITEVVHYSECKYCNLKIIKFPQVTYQITPLTITWPFDMGEWIYRFSSQIIKENPDEID